VIDPGVAIKWFVEEPLRPQARSLLVHGHEVVAPDILIAGVAELAWKKAVAGEIAPDQAEPIVRNIGLPAFVSAFVESTRLRNRALALALQCAGRCTTVLCRLRRGGGAPLVSSDETFLQALSSRDRCAACRWRASTSSPTREPCVRRAAGHDQLQLPAQRLASRRAGAAGGRVRPYRHRHHRPTRWPAWCGPMRRWRNITKRASDAVEQQTASGRRRLETRDGYSLLAYPTDLDAYKRLSRLLTVGNRRAAKGQCDLTFDDLAAYAEGIWPSSCRRAGPTIRPSASGCARSPACSEIAAISPARCCSAATMRAACPARQLAAEMGVGWSPPTTCTTTCPSAGRCRMW
jgi:hypothetical protein